MKRSGRHHQADTKYLTSSSKFSGSCVLTLQTRPAGELCASQGSGGQVVRAQGPREGLFSFMVDRGIPVAPLGRGYGRVQLTTPMPSLRPVETRAPLRWLSTRPLTTDRSIRREGVRILIGMDAAVVQVSNPVLNSRH